MLRRGVLLAIVLITAGCVPSPGPDTTFLYGGWSDDEGRKVRFRGIKTKLPGVAIATYVEGRVELFEGESRRVGVWNFGKTRPFIVLNVVPYDGKVEFWGLVETAHGRATSWISKDPEAFESSDWQQRLPKRELRRLDAEWNPEPKLTASEAGLPAKAEILN